MFCYCHCSREKQYTTWLICQKATYPGLSLRYLPLQLVDIILASDRAYCWTWRRWTQAALFYVLWLLFLTSFSPLKLWSPKLKLQVIEAKLRTKKFTEPETCVSQWLCDDPKVKCPWAMLLAHIAKTLSIFLYRKTILLSLSKRQLLFLLLLSYLFPECSVKF